MRKFSKLTIIIALVAIVTMSVVFAGCQSTKQKPIGTTDKDGIVTSNGNVAVQQGNYLYYVNGHADVATIKVPKDNYFGKATVKGNIMKSKIGEDGALSETAVVVPKFYTSKSKMAGLYIYGEWLYYTSPSTKTNNLGTVETSTLELMRTKTDGTKTQTVAFIKDSVDYVLTKDCLVYFDANKLTKVSFNDSKILDTVEVAKDIAAATFTKGSDKIFFTKNIEDIDKYYNELYVSVAGSEPVKVVGGDTFATTVGAPTFEEQMTIAVLMYDQKENALYFTLKPKGGMHAEKTCTYGYKFGDTFAFDKANMIKYSNTALTSIYAIGADKGVLSIKDKDLVIYNKIAETDIVDSKGTKTSLSAAPTVLFIRTVDTTEYLYYIISDKMYRISYLQEKAVEQLISDDAVGVAFPPSIIGDNIYFIGTTYAYLYKMNFMKFSEVANTLTKATSELVSGYKENDKTKDNKAPKYFTDADLKTYISANLKEEVSK